MIINLRYHIFTITAIFAALGLGILIGSSIIGHEGFVEEQKKIINNIGIDLKKLREENLNLRNELNSLKLQLSSKEDIEGKILSLVLRNKMEKQEYYLVCRENIEKSFKNDLNNFLQITGAQISFVNDYQQLEINESANKVILWNLGKNEEEVLAQLEEEIGKDRIIVYQDQDILGLILTLLESELDDQKQEDFDHSTSLQ